MVECGAGTESPVLSLACLDKEGPCFDPVEFTKALVSTWVTIPPSTRAALNVFRRPVGATDTVNTQLGSVLFDMSGVKGRDIRRYVDRQEVSAVLKELFSGETQRLEVLLDQEIRKIDKMLSEIRDPAREFEWSKSEVETGNGRSFLFFESVETLSEIQDLMFKMTAFAASKLTLGVAKKRPEISQWTVIEIKSRIIDLCDRRGLRFTEDAWAWIDEEEDRI